MSTSNRPNAPPPAAAADTDALAAAVAALLQPLARLAVTKGMPYGAIDALLRQALVRAAHEAHPQLPEHRRVSRVATATGLTRREVTRLTNSDAPASPRRPVAAEVFARWTSDAAYRDARGRPRVLPRHGEAPSFESLAQSVTRDVHPRSLLEELVRLGLARHDADGDRVRLVDDAFVPRGDSARMLGFLGANVGDHLAAAVANVAGAGREHFDQAVFADELSAESVAALRPLIAAQWQALAAALVPRLEALIAADRAAGRTGDWRVRVGLYSFADTLREPRAAGSPPTNDHSRGNP